MGGDSISFLELSNLLSYRNDFSGCIGCRNKWEAQIGKEYAFHNDEIQIVKRCRIDLHHYFIWRWFGLWTINDSQGIDSESIMNFDGFHSVIDGDKLEWQEESFPNKRGRIRIGSSGNLSSDFIPELLHRLHQESPLVRIDVRALSVAEQIRTLHAAEIDVGLATFPINDPALIVRRIFSEPLVLMVQSDSELAQRASISLRELAKERFIICPRYRRAGFHEVIIEHAAKAGFRPRIASEVDAPSTSVALVERGLGVALVPHSE